MAKVSEVSGSSKATHMFWCTACQHVHVFNTTIWKFNGDLDKPTISPSILVQWYDEKTKKDMRCHSFVTDGKIKYLPDCTHDLKGQTVDLEDEFH